MNPDYSARKRGLPTMPITERIKRNIYEKGIVTGLRIAQTIAEIVERNCEVSGGAKMQEVE